MFVAHRSQSHADLNAASSFDCHNKHDEQCQQTSRSEESVAQNLASHSQSTAENRSSKSHQGTTTAAAATGTTTTSGSCTEQFVVGPQFEAEEDIETRECLETAGQKKEKKHFCGSRNSERRPKDILGSAGQEVVRQQQRRHRNLVQTDLKRRTIERNRN